ncbi:AfsR/SARP family transcriptional regulator [Streptosporangium canum]|uniref:AfsR/SARP family transcriptional regulator n=1 Tax=Streptosporangium canum TaxID=324952 RepID=UPI0037B67D7A
MLAALLLDANRVVSVETLSDRLWGQDPPDGARNTLQNYVFRLRRLLGGARPATSSCSHARERGASQTAAARRWSATSAVISG